MKVAVYQRVDAPSQELISESVISGCRHAGEEAYLFTAFDPPLRQDADCVVLFGIGGDAKLIYDLNRQAGKRTVLLDKPYIRAIKKAAPRYSLLRVVVDGFQPLRYFQLQKRPSDRWEQLNMRVLPYAPRQNDAILFDGASNKYIAWNELGNARGTGLEQWANWGQRMVDQIAQHTSRPIIYRARPSHNLTPHIERCHVSQDVSLDDDFDEAAIVVSHGGNIGFDAVVRGIPHFAIGDSIARPLSETDWTRVGKPHIPTTEERKQWLWDLAYCQWTLEEFQSGQAWRYVRETIEMLDAR